MSTYYKLARPDGWDFHTGETINYRVAIGGMVVPPNANPQAQLCSPGILHASLRAEDCFQGATIPCSLYEIEGTPVCADSTKSGFIEMRILRELDPATHFKWRYTEAVAPLNPLVLPLRATPSAHDLALLRQWASVKASVGAGVRASVGDSVRASVKASVGDSVRVSVRDSVRVSVGDSVWDSVRVSVWDSMRDSVRASVGVSVWDSVWISVWDSVWDSVRDSVWAHIGWIFSPVVTTWIDVNQHKGQYPFMPAVLLWQRGLVPSYDGRIWRLHSGPNAQVVWQGTLS